MIRPDQLPLHVAIIMDGNGRWAEDRGFPRIAGHKAGSDNIRPVVKAFADRGAKYLTLYAFSTEHWNRERAEVDHLLVLFSEGIEEQSRAFHQEGIRLVHLGRLDRLPERLKEKVDAAVELTKDNRGLTLCLAFDYGGRDEIVQAANRIAGAGINADDIDEAVFARYLYTCDIPDPDLIVRTGGERRLDNCLLWQSFYSELYFTDVLWPDFDGVEIDKALAEYAMRDRHFGK